MRSWKWSKANVTISSRPFVLQGYIEKWAQSAPAASKRMLLLSVFFLNLFKQHNCHPPLLFAMTLSYHSHSIFTLTLSWRRRRGKSWKTACTYKNLCNGSNCDFIPELRLIRFAPSLWQKNLSCLCVSWSPWEWVKPEIIWSDDRTLHASGRCDLGKTIWAANENLGKSTSGDG